MPFGARCNIVPDDVDYGVNYILPISTLSISTMHNLTNKCEALEAWRVCPGIMWFWRNWFSLLWTAGLVKSSEWETGAGSFPAVLYTSWHCAAMDSGSESQYNILYFDWNAGAKSWTLVNGPYAHAWLHEVYSINWFRISLSSTRARCDEAPSGISELLYNCRVQYYFIALPFEELMYKKQFLKNFCSGPYVSSTYKNVL